MQRVWLLESRGSEHRGTRRCSTRGRAAVNRIVENVRKALPDPAAPFGLVVLLRAKPEHLQRLLASYAAQARAAAANAGNLVYHVNHDPADPAALLLYETWAHFAAFVAHETSDGTVAHFARVANWLEADRSLRVVIDALKSSGVTR